MRTAIVLCAGAFLAGGCSPRDARIDGTLADGWTDEPLFVSVAGEARPLAVQNDSFSSTGLPGGPVDLRIGTGEDEIARMSIGGLPAGATLSLRRIRRDRARDLAFPSAIRLRGAEMVTINGIRMADPETLPRRLDEAGVVLAVGKDALVVRPADPALPDLSVVVTPETRITGVSGDEAELEDASAGDSVRVEGRTDAGYLYAGRIILRGESAGRSSAPVREAPATGEGDARETRDSEGARREERDEKEERRERKRGSGRDDRRIPSGQRPPPGECRDWDPDLPAGQQPPPRKC